MQTIVPERRRRLHRTLRSLGEDIHKYEEDLKKLKTDLARREENHKKLLACHTDPAGRSICITLSGEGTAPDGAGTTSQVEIDY
jgi:hypothetical protein